MLVKLLLILNVVLSFLPGLDGSYDYQERETLRNEPVVMAEDVGLTYSSSGVDLGSHTGTILVERWEYRELAERINAQSGWLRTDLYRCCSKGLASWAAQALMEDDPFTPVALGFEESWICQPDETLGSYVLVLREGKTALRLSGPVDWTAEEYRGILEELLNE